MKLKPFHNQVVLKPIEEEKTVGRIIVPDVENNLPKIGEVIAVGPGTPNLINGELIPIQAKVGQKVAFPTFGGVKFMIKGEEFITIKDSDLITEIED